MPGPKKHQADGLKVTILVPIKHTQVTVVTVRIKLHKKNQQMDFMVKIQVQVKMHRRQVL